MGEHTGHAMAMAAIPEWLRLGGALVLAGVVLVHGAHGAGMRGQRRWWHLGHAAMAAGMAAMFLLPRTHHEIFYQAGAVLFAVLAATTAAAAATLRSREGALNPIWTMSALDCLAMTCMLIDPAVRPAWLGQVFAAYLVIASLGWVARAFDRLPVFARPLPATAAAGAPASPPPAGPALLSAPPRLDTGQAARTRIPVALTLAVMTAAMACMLAFM